MTALAGLKILVVEDEMLVSLIIEDLLADEKCLIVGPFDEVPTALAAAQTEDIDAALLDVNVKGIKIYPVAEALEQRKIPFLFLTGYGNHAIPPQPPRLDRLRKTLPGGAAIEQAHAMHFSQARGTVGRVVTTTIIATRRKS